MEYRGATAHPQADRLEIFRPFGGYTVVTRIGEFKDGDLVAYIPPDNVVPTQPEYAFLWGDKDPTPRRRRVKVKNLRGVYSEGLLVKAPEGSVVGQDVAKALDIQHWEDIPEDAPEHSQKVNPAQRRKDARKPCVPVPHYDIEPLKKFRDILQDDEEVVVTEKIHGCNARYLYTPHRWSHLPLIGRFFKGTFWVGSRNQWKTGNSVWHKAVARRPEIEQFCRANPHCVLFGEVYGDVQDLKYGMGKGEVDFVAFDIYHTPTKRWLDWSEFRRMCNASHVPRVPTIAFGRVEDLDDLVLFAEGNTYLGAAEHVREGCVVRLRHERRSDRIGRVQLKIVGNGYLERV